MAPNSMRLGKTTRFFGSVRSHGLFRLRSTLVASAAATMVFGTALAQSIPALPAMVKSARSWTSGDPAVGTAETLVALDGAADSDVESFVQGDLDVSRLAAGTHRLPVRVTDAAGNEGGTYWLDVVVYESAWEPSQRSVDSDLDGLPDQWETEHFGSLNSLAEVDPDHDGLSNLDELRLGSDPSDALSPANRVMRAEVFIDEDPGVGQAFPMLPVDGLLEDCAEDIQLPSYLTRYLTPGRHVAGIRVQRETGDWSEVRQTDLIVFEDGTPDAPTDYGIVEAEGFWEDFITPGSGGELAMNTPVGGNDVRDTTTAATILSTGQQPGFSRIFYRFKSGLTGYGGVLENLVQILDPNPLVGDVPLLVDSLFGVENNFGLGTQLIGNSFNLRSPWWFGESAPLMPMLGWIGTGDVSAYGPGNSLNVNLQTGGTLTWLWGDATFAVTFHDDQGLGSGKGMLPRYGMVTSAVPEIVHLTPDTRLRCVGWQATGSPSSAGAKNSVTYRLTSDTNIRWLWVKQHRVRIDARHGDVDGWEEWYEEGSSTALQPRPNSGYEFEAWESGLAGSSVPGVKVVTAPMTVVAKFKPTQAIALTVVQIDGTRATEQHVKGNVVDLSPTVSKVETGNTRDVATGWRAEGCIYDSGSSAKASLALTRDTTLYWLPTRQYRIQPVIIPQGAGTVRIEGRQSTGDADWYDAGPIRLIAKHVTGNRFVDWYLQKWTQNEVATILSAELPLVARFAKVEPLGDYAPVDGGALTSPNSAVALFRSYIPSAKMKRTEATTAEYCTYLNWALQAGYIDASNYISVRGANPLAEATEGLKAEWFRGEDWTAEPEFKNIVSSLNLDFGSGSPSQITNGTPNCPFTETDFFSFRLRGQIYSTRTGKISLKEFCDEKVKIVFRGALVLDNTDPNSNAAVQVDAVAGWNDVEFVFVELTGLAKFKVQWDPNGSTAWQDVPASVLRHKRVSDAWTAKTSTYSAPGFREDLELVDLNTADCNIEMVNGVYQPKSGQNNYPLVDVTWHGALAYCQWSAEATGQPVALPDEWLWEYASSGGNSTASGKYYPWGPLFLGATHNNANYTGVLAGTPDVYEDVSPVGIFPTYQGLKDMAGNVFEWTSTLYEQGNPLDPFRVVRGGSWNQPNTLMSASYRLVYKNEYFSDKATGFRPAVVNKVEFNHPGYVEVPPTPAVSSPNSGRVDYAAPTQRYLVSALEITNAEYARFLNEVSAGVVFLDGWVNGNSASTHAGKRLVQLPADGGIELRGGVFVAVPGSQGEPVTSVTWYGADAYCIHQTELVPSTRYALPDQWQWENAMLRGLESLDQGKVNYSIKDTGISKSGSLGTDVRYGTGFWPGFYDAAGNVQEWTTSAPAIGMTDRAVIRGGAFNLETPFVSFTKCDQHAGLEEARPYVGFRPAITAMAPKVEGLFEKVVLPVSGAARKLVFTASSFRAAPVWAWQKVSGPSWVTLADLGSGRCQLTVTPPAIAEDVSVVFSVSDGEMTSLLNVDVSAVVGGSFQIEGLPSAITVRDGEDALLYNVRAIPSGTTGTAVTWSVAGGSGKVSVESTGTLTAKVTVLQSITSSLNVVLSASDGTRIGTAPCAIKSGTPVIELVDFPESITFDDNRASIRVALEAKGGSVSGACAWSVGSSASSWARIVGQNFASAVLEIDRSGFGATGIIPVSYTDGLTTMTRNVQVSETPSAPRILLPASAMQFVAGDRPARVLVTAEDRNVTDTMAWSVEPSGGAVSIVPVNGRSAELVVNTSSPFVDTPYTVRVSDGTLSSTAVIHFTVVNTAPVIAGPDGLQEFDVGSGPYEMEFIVSDPDRGQNPRIEVSGTASWFTWRYDGKSAVRVTVPAATSSDGSLTISATDGLVTITRVVPVRVGKINGTPGINGLPPNLQMARFSAPVRLPFTLTDNDALDRLSVGLVFSIPGVNVLMSGDRTGYLMIDPVQVEEAVPILLEISDGKEKVRSPVQLTLGDAAPDSHQIAVAEYFYDVAPAPGAGIAVPASNNNPFNDTATFVRLAPVPSTLSPGWHRIGLRFRTVAGQWSSFQWLDVHVFDDASRNGLAVTRPDGDLGYSRWSSFNPVAGAPDTLPSWGGGFNDLDPSQGSGTKQDLVFEDNDGIEQIDSAIVWAEYFIDTDPGAGQAARLPMDRRGMDSTLTQLQFDLDSSHLAVGLHQIGLRCRMVDGTWGNVRSISFYVFEDYVPAVAPKAEVVDAEYIWDGSGSPGFGYGLPLDQSTVGTEIGKLESQPVQTSPLDTGDHALHVRFKNDGDAWGETRRWGITVAAPDGTLNLANLHVESNIGIPFLNYDSSQLLGSTVILHVPQIYWVNSLVYANFGFIGQGSVPAYGETNSVNFVMNGASDLTWIWGRDCEVVSRSEFASVTGPGQWQWYPDYNAGYGVFVPLEFVALSVPEFVPVTTGTRQYCVGWNGSGSAPVTGTGNKASFVALAKSSEVNWIWRKEHALKVEVTGEGQVFGNDGWIAEGSTENLTAIPNPGHRFVRWEVGATGSGASTSVVMNAPKTVRAVFTQHRVWTVDPVLGQRQLTGVYEDGAQVSVSSPHFLDLAVGSRFVVTGWTGAGSASQGGAGLSANFTIHADSEVRWAGVRQHWVAQRVNQANLGAIAVTGARVNTENSWFDEGVISIRAVPGAGAVFSRWLSDLEGAPASLDFELRGSVDIAAVFRATVSAPALVSVPAGVMPSSPNVNVTGFEPDIKAFSVAQTETTTADMVIALNQALNEKSIRIDGTKVVGRREHARPSPGFSLSWLDGSAVTLGRDVLADIDGVPIRKPATTPSATHCIVDGELFIDTKSLQSGLRLEGVGSVSVSWNGQALTGGVLPTWVPLNAAMGWGKLRIDYTPTTFADSISMRLTDSIANSAGPLSGERIRHYNAEGGEPLKLFKGMIGASAVASEGFGTQIVSDGSLSVDPASGNFWFAESGGDFDLTATISRPASGRSGLMMRLGLRDDSPSLFVGVSSDGRMNVNGSAGSYSSRSTWTIRIGRRGIVGITEFLDFDGKWKDAKGGTLESESYILFPANSNLPSVVGVFAEGSAASCSGLQFVDLARHLNRQGQVLIDLGWPGATIGYNGSAFASVAGSANLPAVCVTHDGAAQYAEWLEDRLQDGDYGLPSEWEFEYISGGRTGDAYSWGTGVDASSYANLSGAEPLFSPTRLSPVRTYTATNGIFDLAGNAWEWTSSDQVLGHGAWKNIRGASYRQPVESCSSSFRLFYGRQSFASNELGFRVVKRDLGQIALGRSVNGSNLNLASPSEGLVRGFVSPTVEFSIGTVEVSNADYCGFLNALSAVGQVTVSGDWVISNSPAYHQGMRLLMLAGNNGIARDGILFRPVSGKAGQPVTLVPWFGADSFGRWLSASSAEWSFRLPTEWEWESATQTGFVGASTSVVSKQNANQKGIGDSMLDESTMRWGLTGLVSSVAEWTKSEAIGNAGLMVVRGGAANWYSGQIDTSSRVEYLAADSAASHLGFRLARVKKDGWKSVSSDETWAASLNSGVFYEGGSGVLILTRSGDPSFEYTLTLSGSDSRVIIPSTVTFAPGESLKMVSFDLGTDLSVQGDLAATVTIASEFQSSSILSMLIRDVNSAALSVTFGKSILSGGQSTNVRISRNGANSQPLALALRGAAVSGFGLPSAIEIPPGRNYIDLGITAPGVPQTLSLGLQVAAAWYPTAAAAVQVMASSTVSTLNSLVLSSGTLSPVFASATTSYAASVANTVSSITVTPTLTDTTATVKVNGTLVSSGVASVAIPLSVGSNTITVLVTAQDGTTTKTYTVGVTRASSTNFNEMNFTAWISRFPGISNSAVDDPDHDGIPNLLEYVLNGDPTIASSAILPRVSKVNGNFVFRFNRVAGSILDVIQTFQYSSNLTTWQDISLNSSIDVRISLGDADANGVQSVSVTIPAGSNTSMFGRLKANQSQGVMNFTAWISRFPGILNSAVDDPDHDGIPNLLEYVLNGDPTIASPSILPRVSKVNGNFVFRFNRVAGSILDVIQTFQYSPNLTTWQDISLNSSIDARISLGDVDANGVQSVFVTIPSGSNTSMFGRLKADQR